MSGIVALTLTPALCALLLKPGHSEPWLPFPGLQPRLRLADPPLHWNRHLLPAPRRRGSHADRHDARRDVVAVPAGPRGLVPAEDQGAVFLVTALPAAASLDHTVELTQQATDGRDAGSSGEGRDHCCRFRLALRGAEDQRGRVFVNSKDWSERKDPRLDATWPQPSGR